MDTRMDTMGDSTDSRTAPTVEANSTAAERCVQCSSSRVTNHKFWHGNFLPMCRHCFADFIKGKHHDPN